jgi:hypothetical protein
VGSIVFGERSSERGGSTVQSVEGALSAGSGVQFRVLRECCLQVREHEGVVWECGGALAVRHLAGSAVKEAGARFGRSGARFGDAPARSAVQSPDRGGGAVWQLGPRVKELLHTLLKSHK